MHNFDGTYRGKKKKTLLTCRDEMLRYGYANRQIGNEIIYRAEMIRQLDALKKGLEAAQRKEKKRQKEILDKYFKYVDYYEKIKANLGAEARHRK